MGTSPIIDRIRCQLKCCLRQTREEAGVRRRSGYTVVGGCVIGRSPAAGCPLRQCGSVERACPTGTVWTIPHPVLPSRVCVNFVRYSLDRNYFLLFLKESIIDQSSQVTRNSVPTSYLRRNSNATGALPTELLSPLSSVSNRFHSSKVNPREVLPRRMIGYRSITVLFRSSREHGPHFSVIARLSSGLPGECNIP